MLHGTRQVCRCGPSGRLGRRVARREREHSADHGADYDDGGGYEQNHRAPREGTGAFASAHRTRNIIRSQRDVSRAESAVKVRRVSPSVARIRCRPRVRASSRAAVNRLSWVARRIRIRSAVSEAMSPASTFSKSPSARTSSTPRFAFCSTQSCSSAHPPGRLPERLARAPGMLKARPASMKSLAGHRHHATRSGRPANRLGRRARRPVFGCERRACLGGSGYASRPS